MKKVFIVVVLILIGCLIYLIYGNQGMYKVQDKIIEKVRLNDSITQVIKVLGSPDNVTQNDAETIYLYDNQNISLAFKNNELYKISILSNKFKLIRNIQIGDTKDSVIAKFTNINKQKSFNELTDNKQEILYGKSVYLKQSGYSVACVTKTQVQYFDKQYYLIFTFNDDNILKSIETSYKRGE
ncbi:MAG: hypothetical protein RSB76_01155 [Clostridia bacterium]